MSIPHSQWQRGQLWQGGFVVEHHPTRRWSLFGGRDQQKAPWSRRRSGQHRDGSFVQPGPRLLVGRWVGCLLPRTTLSRFWVNEWWWRERKWKYLLLPRDSDADRGLMDQERECRRQSTGNKFDYKSIVKIYKFNYGLCVEAQGTNRDFQFHNHRWTLPSFMAYMEYLIGASVEKSSHAITKTDSWVWVAKMKK